MNTAIAGRIKVLAATVSVIALVGMTVPAGAGAAAIVDRVRHVAPIREHLK